MSQLDYRPKSGMLYISKYLIRLFFCCVFFFILGSAYPDRAIAFTAHEFTESASTSSCLRSWNGSETTGCHDLHEAPSGRQRTTTSTFSLMALSDEKDVCFTCHNGYGSDYDTASDFGESKASTHNATNPELPGFLLCSDCHSSHMKPDQGEPVGGWKGNEVIGLLRVLISNVWYYLINPDNIEWTDEDGKIQEFPEGFSLRFPSKKKLADPSDFCGGCHQIENQYFSASLHSTALTTHANNRPTNSANTSIKCNVCHQWHGADNEKLLSSNVNGVTVSANNNIQCYACHTDPTQESAYQGKSLFETTKHFTATSSTIAEVITTTGYQAGYCMNCHDPHGTQYNDLRRGQNDLCFTCHDNIAKVIPVSYSYQGQATYSISAHADNGDNETKWPSTAYTGNTIGGGGGAAAGECINCHAPMGRDDGGGTTAFSKLLNDWAVGDDSNEQNLCFGGDSDLGKCHAQTYTYNDDSDNFYNKSTVNIFERFGYALTARTGPNSGATVNGRHDILKTDQDASGAKIECSSCHNTHTNNKTYDFNNKSRVSDPDNRAVNYSAKYSAVASFSNNESFKTTGDDQDSSFGENMPDFVNYCLKCHDNTGLPDGVSLGTTPTANILSTYGNSTTSNADKHGRGDGIGANLKFPYYGSSGQSGSTTEAYSAMNCTDCHDPHGSSNIYKLKTTVAINGTTLSSGSTTVTDNTYGGRTGWCMTCHSSLPDSGPDDHAGAAYDNCGSCHYHGNNF